ncbi:hypothetical protein NQ317_002812 [Molorchus minor]|uniref:Peptidase M12B domain-containing protein n=1 Tax=Molorchus minor TaxID=1323400 RepID=A0ABQ9JQ04_9CUCU|nr:hypothetical protein NQ317_002812 [Molorchus minor]
MCRRSYPNDACNRGTAGFAYVGGACVVNKRLEKVNSVAIIEDTGGFSGIIVAAHEVGHLLGAVHDGSPPPSYLGGPGAEKCQWTDGYIMSDLRHTERGFRWSPCSVASFHHFLNGDTATCLYNTPHEDENLARVLPGKLLTLDAQCRRDRGTSACFKDDRVCAQLFCFDSGSGYCVAYRPAAEGSPCGDGQTCTNGRCVAEHENIIPDYTQNSPSYIRGSGNQGRPLFHEEEEEALNLNPIQPYNYYNADTTQPPYENPLPPQYYQYQNNPYDFQSNQYPYSLQTQDFSGSSDVTSQAPVSTTTRYTFRPLNLFTFSTTKSPYDFKNFGKKSTTSPLPHTLPIDYQTNPVSTYTTSTISPFLNSLNNFRRQTTKNPYDFANFGKMTQSQYADNNHLKRSYNAASYYTDSSNITETVLKGTPVVG